MTASMLGNAIALNLYVNREYLPSGVPYHFLLYPFWGMIPERVGDPDENRFMEYADKGKELFAFTSKEVADAFLLPVSWELLKDTSPAFQLAKETRAYGKPIIVFCCSDSADAIPLENAIVFRTSGFRSRQKSNEFGLPAWPVDFLTYTSGILSVRKKAPRPSFLIAVTLITKEGGPCGVKQHRGGTWRVSARILLLEEESKCSLTGPGFAARLSGNSEKAKTLKPVLSSGRNSAQRRFPMHMLRAVSTRTRS